MKLDFEHSTTQILDNKRLEAVKAYEEALIFGAGESGDWVRGFLEIVWGGVYPKCYIDNYKPKQGTIRNGLMIMSFEDAIAKYENACMCIGSLWADEIIKQIYNYEPKLIERVIDFRGAMVWEIKEKIFRSEETDYIKRNKEKFDILESKLFDAESKHVLRGILNYRITRDQSYLKDIVCENEEYVDEDIVPCTVFEERGGEIIDGGAFDGDTVGMLAERYNVERLTIHCYEPSKDNANRIREKKDLWKNFDVIIHESGLQSQAGNGALKGNGLGGTISKTDAGSKDSVRLECIDDGIWDNLRLIKLDIEGAELDALLGGRNSIKKYRPVLAICAYHKQDDLLTLSDYIAGLENYRLYLRHYMNATSETIIYGVPEELFS